MSWIPVGRPSYALSLSYGNSAEVIPVFWTRMRMARLGIAIYREFNLTGSFPTQLVSFGDLSRDARDGRPFVYSYSANGFTLKARRINY